MLFLAAMGTAHAADPLGEWQDEDGKATIRIVDCDSRLWGVIASESIPGGVDSNNPDKAKRTRPTLGMPVLLNMKRSVKDAGKWEGKIYNAENGKTYAGSLRMEAPDALRVEGCLVWPLCGGQTWSRVAEATPTPPAPAPGGAKGAKTGATGMTGAPKTTARPAAPAGAPKTGMAPTTKGAAAKGAAAKGAVAVADPASDDVCLLPEIAGAAH
jgi:uncharacterized protein (DUF2147 family)